MNPQYNEDLQWKWFQEVRRRYGLETSDSDWPCWTGSQPEHSKPQRSGGLADASKDDAGAWNSWKKPNAPRTAKDNDDWRDWHNNYLENWNKDGTRGRRPDRDTARGRASQDHNTWQGGQTGKHDDPWKQEDPWPSGADPQDAAKKQENGDQGAAPQEGMAVEGRAVAAGPAGQGGGDNGGHEGDDAATHENGEQGQGQQTGTGGGDGGGHDGDQAGGKEGGAAGGGKGGGKGGGIGGGKGRGRKGGGKSGWEQGETRPGGGKGAGKWDTPGTNDENGGKGGGGGGGQAGDEARSQGKSLNGRRSPGEKAWPIDIFDDAVASKPMQIEWQYLEYDCNSDIAYCRRFYWEQYDERDHTKLTAAYQAYQSGESQTHMTSKRNPGRSDKVWDQHQTDFLDLTSMNIDPKHHSPKRAVRVVMITQCEKQDVLGSLPIDDNNQTIVWQYEDFKGWKNFCTNHIGELNQAVLADKKEITLKAWYHDSWLQQPRHTKITVDLENMKQNARTTRNVRVVHVTPILQKGDDGVEAPSEHTNSPVWSSQGPRIKNKEEDQ